MSNEYPVERYGSFLINAHHPNLLSSLAAYPETPEPINWDYYRQKISKPGLVDNFQKQFEALKIPYPKDTATPVLEEQRKKIVSFFFCLRFIEDTPQNFSIAACGLANTYCQLRASKPSEQM